LVAKAASNENVGGHMTACNDKSGRQKTMQQPTNNGRIKGRHWWWQQWQKRQQRQWQWWRIETGNGNGKGGGEGGGKGCGKGGG
jgi:hypothetical protein